MPVDQDVPALHVVWGFKRLIHLDHLKLVSDPFRDLSRGTDVNQSSWDVPRKQSMIVHAEIVLRRSELLFESV